MNYVSSPVLCSQAFWEFAGFAGAHRAMQKKKNAVREDTLGRTWQCSQLVCLFANILLEKPCCGSRVREGGEILCLGFLCPLEHR